MIPVSSDLQYVSCLPAVRVWPCSKRCWRVAVLACARLLSPRLWRCSRYSFKMLADLVSGKANVSLTHSLKPPDGLQHSNALFSPQRPSSKNQSWCLRRSWWPPTPCPAAPTSPAPLSRHREPCRPLRSPRSFSKRRASRGSTKAWGRRWWGKTQESLVHLFFLLFPFFTTIPSHVCYEQYSFVLFKFLPGTFPSLSFTSRCLPTSTILASPTLKARRPSTGRSSPAVRRDRQLPWLSTPVTVSIQRHQSRGNRLLLLNRDCQST